MTLAASLDAQRGPSVFTQAQADAGRTEYQERCAACHGAELTGNAEAPPLAGSGFMASWGAQTTLDLFRYAQGMPPGVRGLTPAQYVNVLAFVLQRNGALPGAEPLTTTTEVRIDTIAIGVPPVKDRR